MLPSNLIVTIIQTHLHWHDTEANLNHFNQKLNSIVEPTDVIVLPEMFTTGFTMQPALFAEEHEGKGLQWMKQKSLEKQCAIVGSIAVKENNHFFNRLYWVNADGTHYSYDKRHLFRMGNEDQHYTAGKKPIIINYKGWKICPLICYDLRFPVWSRNQKKNPYDVLIYVANWPAVRTYPWEHLLIARAIENQSYVVGVNRIGDDGNKVSHSGNSLVLNARGEKMNHLQPHEDVIETTTLTYQSLLEFRGLFPVLLDGDDFEVMI